LFEPGLISVRISFYHSLILNPFKARGTTQPSLNDVYRIAFKLRPQADHSAGGWVNRFGRLVRITFSFHIDRLDC